MSANNHHCEARGLSGLSHTRCPRFSRSSQLPTVVSEASHRRSARRRVCRPIRTEPINTRHGSTTNTIDLGRLQLYQIGAPPFNRNPRAGPRTRFGKIVQKRVSCLTTATRVPLKTSIPHDRKCRGAPWFTAKGSNPIQRLQWTYGRRALEECRNRMAQIAPRSETVSAHRLCAHAE